MLSLQFPLPQSNEARVSREDLSDSSVSVVPETLSTDHTYEASSPSEKPSEDDMPAVTSRVSTASSASMANVDTSMPLKVFPMPTERGNSDIYVTDWEDRQTDDREGLTEYSPSQTRKKRESHSTTSPWEKFKSPFTGRKSRSKSFARARKDDVPTPH
jgi:hypothetical protein